MAKPRVWPTVAVMLAAIVGTACLPSALPAARAPAAAAAPPPAPQNPRLGATDHSPLVSLPAARAWNPDTDCADAKSEGPCPAHAGYCVLDWGEPGGHSEALWCVDGAWQLEREVNLP